MAESLRIVVALGGNAISRANQQGNVDEQFENSRGTAVALVDLIASGHQLIITHGNGPQIGNFLLRNTAAAGAVYRLPMVVAVAHVQGGMGYMLAQTINNELYNRGDRRIVTAVVTTVLVDPKDPAFDDPSKPIGTRLTPEEAERFKDIEGWRIKEIEPGVYRRFVPSPQPAEILEIEHIRRGVEAGEILVVCGGGGIPAVRGENGMMKGIAAVIDKDFATAMLAAEVNADAMMILTDVDYVRLNFGKPDERQLDTMSVDEAKFHLSDGQFPPGSMGPKVRSAIKFLEASSRPDAYVVIGPLDKAVDAVAGRIGTRITK
jgi:carbamate kinase